VATYQQVTKYFQKIENRDGSGAVRNARAVKTAYDRVHPSGGLHQLDKMFLDIPSQLREGLAGI